MTTRKNRLLTIILTLIFIGTSAAAGFAETANTVTNVDEYGLKGFSYGPNAPHVCSYLTTAGDKYMKVQGTCDQETGKEICYAIYYDSSFNYLSRKEIEMPLPLFGGFYESASNYYLVTGNTNKGEDDSVEVLRVTKYDKDWNPKDDCRFYGRRIRTPFDFGGCSITMLRNMLVVYMSCTAYKSSDGHNHQSSTAFTIDTDSMTEIEDGLVTGASHSFKQLAMTDGNAVILADHGDGYPRGYYIHKHEYDLSSETPSNTGWNMEIAMKFPGEIGNNYTGADTGGIKCSPTHILFTGSAVYRNGLTEQAFKNNRTKDAFVMALDKNTMKVTSIDWLTNLRESDGSATTPHIVKISDSRFAVLWEQQGNILYYTFVDNSGERISKVYSTSGKLSDCAPIVRGGKIIWFTWMDNDEDFYTISISNPENITKKALKYKSREEEEIDMPDYMYEEEEYEEHELVSVSKVATCQEAGVKKHYECTDCGKWFKDAKGKQVLTAKEIKKLTIKKKKHSFKEKSGEYLKSEASCTKPALYYYTCKMCHSKGTKTYKSGKKLGHDFVPGSIKKATAKKDGKIAAMCSRCGKTSKGTKIPKASKTVVLSRKTVPYTGDGREKEAVKIVIKKSKYPLAENEYEVTYSEPVYKGKKSKGTITVRFKPECRYYSGSLTLTYKITKTPKK